MSNSASVRGTVFVDIPNQFANEDPVDQGRIRIPNEKWIEQIRSSAHGRDSGISCAFSTATDSPDMAFIAFVSEEDSSGKKYLFDDPDVFGFEVDLYTLRGLHRALGFLINELESKENK